MELSDFLTDTQMETLQSNSEALGVNAGEMIGFLLDDHFGGLPIGEDSFQSVREHVDMLESMLTDGLE
jgi:hypothetical protein